MNDYPSEEDLARIEGWPLTDLDGLLDFLRKIWHWPEYLTVEGGMWRLATGGWSGNEEIVAALRKNHMVWVMCWQRSERGGLHWFKPNWKNTNAITPLDQA